MADDNKQEAKKEGAGQGKWQVYETGDELKRSRKSCPKCGVGVFLAQHEDRNACGKCGYTEFTKDKLYNVFPEHLKKQREKDGKKRAEEEKKLAAKVAQAKSAETALAEGDKKPAAGAPKGADGDKKPADGAKPAEGGDKKPAEGDKKGDDAKKGGDKK